MQGLPPTVQLVGIGWYVALSILLGVGGGVLLDGALDTKPIFTLLGLVLGLVMAFWGGYVQLKDVLDTISSRDRGKQ
jgi:hypothetical protein